MVNYLLLTIKITKQTKKSCCDVLNLIFLHEMKQPFINIGSVKRNYIIVIFQNYA